MKVYKPLVSVVMPSYNSEKFISAAIESVIEQSLSQWELLIIDDCSTDATTSIIENYIQADNRIKLIKNTKNQGPGQSRNLGIEKATGTWIAFLDSDDVWVNKKLELQLSFAQTSNAVFTHSSYGYMDQHGKIAKEKFRVSEFPVSYNHLLKRTEISCLTAMYNQEKIGKFYMSQHRHKQDYALWLSILKAGYISYPQNEVLAYYRQSPNSNTHNKFQLISKHYKFLRETQNLSCLNSAFYTLFWGLNGISRYYLKLNNLKF